MVFENLGPSEFVEPFPLSGGELRNWLFHDTPDRFWLEASGAEQLDFLRLQGVQISSEAFYNIRAGRLYLMGEVASLRGDLTRLALQFPDALLPAGLAVYDHGWQMSADWLYRFKLTGTDPITGEATESYMMIASDTQLTYQQARDRVSSMIGPEGTNTTPGIVEWELDSAYGRPELIA